MTPMLAVAVPSLEATVITLAALTSVALTAAALAHRPRGRLHWSFALGMAGWGLQSIASLVLLSWTSDPGDRELWLHLVEGVGLLALIPWGMFVVALGQREGMRLSGRQRGVLVAGGMLLAAASVSPLLVAPFEIAAVDGAFHAARVVAAGAVAVSLELLATIGILAGLEAPLRASSGDARWRTKYLVLGLGGVFLVRFYLLSQIALFGVMFASYLTTAAAAQLIGNIVIAVSLARRLLASELAISRFVLYRSVVFAVLGIYLLCIALLGLVFNRLGIAEDVFWGSMLVFVSALGLAALLLSDRARWRVKKFVVRNFYRTKYDYRQQWTDFTTRLGSLLSADDLAPVFLGMVVQNVGTPLGRILLEDPRDGRYYSMASVGPSTAMDALEPTSPLVAMLAVAPGPVVVGSECPADRLDLSPGDGFGDGSIVVPLRWRARLAGILILGPERTGALYTEEDREFLVTVAEQAAGAITTARLSESLAQAREFEAFTRITSFILHDLKNSVSALSMLSENAVKHLDDPEFRRDALSTLARTVERMTALMGRLTTSGADALHLAPVDVAAIAAEAARPLRNGNRVSLVQDLSAVPPVLGDADALLKVFQNVIANAAQSIDGDGVVTVRAYSESGRVVASVSDTGCGMSEEFIRRSLFSPFRSSKKGGWGIGLFQAKGIVEAHGGVIDVASKPGAGTTFSVRLPPHPEGTGR